MNTEESIGSDPEFVLKKLKQLFLYYSTCSSNGSVSHITTQKLQKLFRDAAVLDRMIKSEDLNLIITSEKRKQKLVNFDTFCNILTRVAKVKFPEFQSTYSTTSTLYALLDQYIFPLYDSLIESGEIKLYEDIDIMIDEECLTILSSFFESLKEIYSHNFSWELVSSEHKAIKETRSKSVFMNMMATFNVFPDLIGQQMVNKL